MATKSLLLFSYSGLNFAAMKAASALYFLSVILVSGCGAPMQPKPISNPQTFTAEQVFNTSMIGQTWTFQNGYGDITMVEVQSAPFDAAGTHGTHIILHFVKTADRAYWGVNIPQAEDHFLMFQNPDGSWRGVADIPTLPQSCPWCSGHTLETLNPRPVPGLPLPYMIVPASITEGQVISNPTQYEMWQLWDINTIDDIVNPPTPSEQGSDMGGVNWNTEFSIEDVSTPAYTGLAVVSHQFEGCNEEKWYFAPNIGLVEIIPIANCIPFDVNIIIKRIH